MKHKSYQIENKEIRLHISKLPQRKIAGRCVEKHGRCSNVNSAAEEYTLGSGGCFKSKYFSLI